MRKKHIYSLNLLWAGLILLVFSSMRMRITRRAVQLAPSAIPAAAAVAGRRSLSPILLQEFRIPLPVTGAEIAKFFLSAPAYIASVQWHLGLPPQIAENITVSIGNRQRIDLTLEPG
jgi:hypothetical protein